MSQLTTSLCIFGLIKKYNKYFFFRHLRPRTSLCLTMVKIWWFWNQSFEDFISKPIIKKFYVIFYLDLQLIFPEIVKSHSYLTAIFFLTFLSAKAPGTPVEKNFFKGPVPWPRMTQIMRFLLQPFFIFSKIPSWAKKRFIGFINKIINP